MARTHRFRIHHRVWDELKNSLEIEVHKNERFRALLLAALGLILLTGFLIRNAHGVQMSGYLIDSDRVVLGAWLLAGFGVYEAGFAWLLHQLLKHQRRLPRMGRFGNSTVEIAWMYSIVLAMGWGLPPAVAIEIPASYIPLVLIGLSALRLSVGLSLWTGLAAAVGYGITYFLLLQAWDSGLAAGMPPTEFDPFLNAGRIMACVLIGVATAIVGSVTTRWMATTIQARDDRERVLHIFGQQVSPEVVNKLLSQETTTAQGEMRNVCVLFVDIRNFTGFSESRSPEEVVSFLNTMFSFMVDEINRHEGIVNKFLGDGFMAVFGAPIDDIAACRNALNASRQMLSRLDELRTSGAIPDVQLGIGLNAGQALTGQVGGHERKEYTIIGDVVNLASRIESLNKEYGTRLIASEYVVAQLAEGGGLNEAAAAFGLSPLGTAQVRGRAEPVRLFRG